MLSRPLFRFVKDGTRIRFMRGPSLATASFTYRLSTSMSRPCSPLR